jgi:hypothetical protein
MKTIQIGATSYDLEALSKLSEEQFIKLHKAITYDIELIKPYLKKVDKFKKDDLK